MLIFSRKKASENINIYKKINKTLKKVNGWKYLYMVMGNNLRSTQNKIKLKSKSWKAVGVLHK